MPSIKIAIEKLKGDLSEPEKAFYEGKKFSGIYYAMNIVPEVIGDAKTLKACDESPLAISDAAFGPE